MQRFTREPAQAVEHRALDQAYAKRRQQGRERAGCGPGHLLPIELAPEFEGGKREMVILSSAHLRPRYRSRPWTKAAIFRSATERLSIQKPQSGCAKRTRPGPRACSAHSRARAISSGVSI